MTFDTELRESLADAARSMPSNPQRHDDVVRRATRWRARRAMATGAMALTSIATVAVIVAAVADSPARPASLPTPAASATTRTVQFHRAVAVPGGIRIEFVGANPSLSAADPCGKQYRAQATPGADGELLVTIVGHSVRPSTPPATPTVCHAIGYPRQIDVPTDEPYDIVVDTSTGIRHQVR